MKMNNVIKDWLKVIFIVLLALVINTYPIILSITYNNWWLMLLYFTVPILDGIYLVFLKAMLEIFKW